VCEGEVRLSPVKFVWFFGMLAGALAGVATLSLGAFALFVVTTGIVLLFGHSLGSHRKLIHDSYACPKWVEYLFVYCGVQVGLDGPLGLMRQHELRDYAQRLPVCHDYLRHGRSFWKDAWWQLACSLHLSNPPEIRVERRIAEDRFYVFLQRTWMAQQLPWALLFYAWGGWGFVAWGVCARVLAGVGGHWLIGYFAHNRGGMNYEVRDAAVQGHNIPWTSLLTMGECWHNNHHAFPGSARLGLGAGEWDPGWWTLKLLRRWGLVWGFRLPAHLPHRPELVRLRDVEAAEAEDRCEISLGMRDTVRLALALRAARRPLAMRWPAATISQRAMSRLLGESIALDFDPAVSRLTLSANSSRIRGLPAVCAALAQRGLGLRLFAWLALPFAVAFEGLRTSLEAQGPGRGHDLAK
jgi:stearoyl-CoA desaturase (delta-9 desaturase)